MVVCGILVWCPYQFLIEVTMLLMVVMTYPFLASFVWLRISQPDVPRAFRVPVSTFAIILSSHRPTQPDKRLRDLSRAGRDFCGLSLDPAASHDWNCIHLCVRVC